MSKICYKCKEEKEDSEFGIKKDGNLYSYCRTCEAIRIKEYKKNNRQKIREQKERYNQKYSKENFKREISPKQKESKRNYKLKSEFNITIEDYDRMLKDQNYCCAICGKNMNNFNRKLAVDHDHETGRVRGLLCHSCNVGLGCFKDNIAILKNAIGYLIDNQDI